MNTLKKKVVATVLILSSMTAISTPVYAEEASVEKVLARVVLNQGTRVMNEVSAQLQQSIEQNLRRFSIDVAASWFDASTAFTSETKALNNTPTPKSSEE